MNYRIMTITAVLVSFLSLVFSVSNRSKEEHNPTTAQPDKAQVVEIIKETLNDNPEIILESVEKYRNAKMQEAVEEQKRKVRDLRPKLESNPTDPRIGNMNAGTKIVEFFDYNCGYCKKMGPIKAELIKSDSDLQFIFKELPIMSQSSLKLTRAALSVYQIAPEKYASYQAALFALDKEPSDDDLVTLATSFGVDAAAFKAMVGDAKITKIIEGNMQLAQEIGLRGTPFYVVNGEIIQGAADLEGLRKQIEQVRSASKASTQDAPKDASGADTEAAKEEPVAVPVEEKAAEQKPVDNTSK